MFLDCFTTFPVSTSEKAEGISSHGTHNPLKEPSTTADSCQKVIPLNKKLVFAAAIALSLPAVAQTDSQTTLKAEHMSTTPTFRVTVISRSVQAVNYQHRSGSSKVDFAGTDLMPAANGVAEVNSKRGSIAIEAEFGDLQKPTTFGNEYLTYVLWAISPEGRAVNLGEVLVGGNHRSKLTVTTDLQAFALIVTAEPYYAVRQPSNAVILENVVREGTKGTTEAVNAKYELMERGGYLPTGYKFDPVILSARLPLEFLRRATHCASLNPRAPSSTLQTAISMPSS